MVTAGEVVEAITPILDHIVRLSDRVRVVGTASSGLRGIELPIGDVDILARDPDAVDELAAASGSPPATWVETPFGRQYLADHRVAGVPLQLSMVESDGRGRKRLAECVGEAPWRYFSFVDVAGRPVPVVASELRLASDLMRGRAERWRPIATHLVVEGYDQELLGLAVLGFPQRMLDDLRQLLGT